MAIEKSYITGYYGCSCHPFDTWAECEKAHKQKLPIGTPVKNRHTGREGVVFAQKGDGYVTVKYGKYERDKVLEHVARLTKKG